jgi:hypothetical protein
MGVRIRRCSTTSCKVGQPIELQVEGFIADESRGCTIGWGIASANLADANIELGELNGSVATGIFTAEEPGCYTVLVACCCNAANVPPEG